MGKYPTVAGPARGAMRVLLCALLVSGALGTAPASAWRSGVTLHEGAHFGSHFAGDHFGARYFASGRSWGHLSWGRDVARGHYGGRGFGFASGRLGRFHVGYATGWRRGSGHWRPAYGAYGWRRG